MCHLLPQDLNPFSSNINPIKKSIFNGSKIFYAFLKARNASKRPRNVSQKFPSIHQTFPPDMKRFLKLRNVSDAFLDVSRRFPSSPPPVFPCNIAENSLMERYNINMCEAGLQIDKDCRVLTVHGYDDKIVRRNEALEFAIIIANHKSHIVKATTDSRSIEMN